MSSMTIPQVHGILKGPSKEKSFVMALKQRPEYDLKVIGRNLKRLREANHLTVQEIRDYLRLGSVQAVYKYEKGLSYPQTDAMFALMELYGVGLHDIVDDHTCCLYPSDFFFAVCCSGYTVFFVKTDGRGRLTYRESVRFWGYYCSWQKKG